jgi:hypothetical protein
LIKTLTRTAIALAVAILCGAGAWFVRREVSNYGGSTFPSGPSALLQAAVAALTIAIYCGVGVWLVRRGMSYDVFVLYVGLAVPLILFLTERL